MNRRIILFCASMMMCGLLSSQTMHVINYGNTIDPKIGTSVKVDYERLNAEASFAASAINYRTAIYDGTGENCSRERLLSVLSSLSCAPDDIILFYYSGHGMRSDKDKNPFPQMCLKYEAYEQDKWIPVHQVVDALSNKGARLVIVLTDCCNSIASWVSAKAPIETATKAAVDDSKVSAIYRKLFLENKGVIVATSSSIDQTSGCNNDLGGFFSWALFDCALYSAGLGNVQPVTWNNIFEATGKVLKSGGATQVPYYEVKLNTPSATPQPQPQPQQPATTTVVSTDNQFSQDFSSLFANGLTKESRLKIADAIADKYFTVDAKVATVGRNRTTVIDYEDVRDFLHRIALSTFIKQINVIQENKVADGRRNYIKIQEIRKQ